jgi:7-keto-8-aminopelargonate synthetase-like enzyme
MLQYRLSNGPRKTCLAGVSSRGSRLLEVVWYPRVMKVGDRTMDTNPGAHRERVVRLVKSQMDLAMSSGLIRLRVDEQAPTGESVTIDGNELLNFGSCAYLGLNVDERLKAGAKEAIERYGPVFSSSNGYTSVGLYSELEERLERIFGGNVLVPTTTTLGHLSVLPLVVTPDDLVLLDRQVHGSVQLTAQVLRGIGATVEDVPHNDIEALSSVLDSSAKEHRNVWYLADGVYSMYGDTAPVADIVELMNSHPNLYTYFDDAHGVGWHGTHGKGLVLSETPLRDRMIVIGSLAKSWGAGGSVLVLPDEEIAELVFLTGTSFTFSGPLHPAQLGAAVAAADIHLSEERDVREQKLMGSIDFVRDRAVEHQLPLMSLERTPIWFIRVGSPENTIELGRRLMAEGFYTNLSAYPLVPLGESGLRFTTTLYQTEDHLERFMDALARHIPELAVPMVEPVDLR